MGRETYVFYQLLNVSVAQSGIVSLIRVAVFFDYLGNRQVAILLEAQVVVVFRILMH